MTQRAGSAKTFDFGDTVTFNGTTRTIADINYNVRPACDCPERCCPRVQFEHGGYARTCQLVPAAPAEQTTAPVAEIDRTRTAGQYLVRLHTTGAGQTWRVEVTHATGGIVHLDTIHGLADMTCRFDTPGAAQVAANETVTWLRAGLNPLATAQLTLGYTCTC